MASPPFAIAETSPAPTDLVSSFPADEQSNRDIIESWLTILSDPATGQLKSSAFALPFTLTSTAAGTIFTFQSSEAGATAGPNVLLERSSASPAASDLIGSLVYQGRSSTGVSRTYGSITGTIIDTTNAAEDGTLSLNAMIAGTVAERIKVADEVIVGLGGTSGRMAFGMTYSAPNVLQTFGSDFSTGNMILGFAVKPKPATSGAFVSSAGNSSFTKGALRIGNSLNFYTAGAATVAIDADVAMTEVFSISAAGNLTSLGIDDNATGERLQIADDLMTVGASGADYAIGAAVGTGVLRISAQAGGGLGGHIDIPGSGHTAVGDVYLVSDGDVVQQWDESALTMFFPRGAISITGAVTAASFSGVGTSLTALNATNLTSGTVPSARVSGSYTGITGTGALDAGSITSGFGAIDIGSDTMTAGTVSTVAIVGASGGSLTLRPSGIASTTGQAVLAGAGTLTLNGVLRASDGAASAPALSFANDTNTGFYSGAGDEIHWATAGSFRGNLTNTNMNFGKTAANAATVGLSLGTDGQGIFTVAADAVLILNRTGADGTVVQIRNDNVTVGTIEVAGAVTNYNTSSDGRMKYDFKPFDSGAIVDALEFGQFKWKLNGETGYGIIAQDAKPIFAQAISGNDDNGYQADYSKYVPVAMAEIKNIRQRLAAAGI